MTLNSFEDLKCWQACHEFRGWAKDVIRTWPSDEKFDLTDQLRRCSRGSCRNIAEGFGRNNSKDNARFCKTAIGSLNESLDILIDAHQSGYVSDETLFDGREKIQRCLKITWGYVRYLYKNQELREPEAEYVLSNIISKEKIQKHEDVYQPSTNNTQL